MIAVEDWGLVEYSVALERQRRVFEGLIARKSGVEQGLNISPPRGGDGGLTVSEETGGVIVFCEHPAVFTLGRNGDEGNILRRTGVSIHRTDRGGDVTFHGPGQVVCYPILELGGLGLREYVGLLEQSVIETLAEFGIEGFRREGYTGVWTAGGKICAIGVRASRGVVMHGLALNVTTDLSWFGFINPCGESGGEVTSVVREIESGRSCGEANDSAALCGRSLGSAGSGSLRRVLEEKIIKKLYYGKAMGNSGAG